jgi:hypothetical protein
MTKKLFNPYGQQVHVQFVDQNGQLDGAHLQPGSGITLPNNSYVHPNTLAIFPRLRVTDSSPVEGAEALPVVEEVIPTKTATKG